MQIRKLAAITLGKTILTLTRTFKIGGGSAAPGLYALKIYPQLVSDLCRGVPKTVVITGTNGKTTTARMLAHFLTEQGMEVLRNSTGSNLERGVASSLIDTYPKKYDLAIWELDEAAFNSVATKVKPNLIIFLNVFRDQLDRYGEVDTIVKNWSQSLKKIDRQTIVLLNGDDHNLLQLKDAFKGQVKTFGVENYKIAGERVTRQPDDSNLDFEATRVKVSGLEKTSFNVKFHQFELPIRLPLPGIYHIYNFLAAFAALFELELPVKPIAKQLENFSPAFGRVEKLLFKLSGGRVREAYIFLIKNPAGATQVFQTLKDQLKPEDRLLVVLNDRLADGTDISWIWDADFELLQNPSRTKLRDYHTIISGTRADDLALRLKYAGFDFKSLDVHPDLKKALVQAKRGLQGRLFILPTYTALLELQKILAKSGAKKHYWQEN